MVAAARIQGCDQALQTRNNQTGFGTVKHEQM